MREYDFAARVGPVASGDPPISHLPFAYYPERGPHGDLVAHMARAFVEMAALVEAQESRRGTGWKLALTPEDGPRRS